MKRIFNLLVCLLVLYNISAFPQSGVNNTDDCEKKDAYFSNPVFWADVPDVDVIRVDDYYYMISTTMYLMPGAPIMRSKDMVNWETISYLFDRLDDNDTYNTNQAYARGQWAASIRYHKGKFYVIFATGNGNKSYIFSATDPAGKWDKIIIDEFIHDNGLLFDDNGKVYIVSGNSRIRLRELNPDMSGFKTKGIDKEIISGVPEGLLEGSHLYKINGMYYLLMIWWPHNGERTQVCFRSKKIDGPYEMEVILSDNMGFGRNGVAQGAIWDTPQGDWYGMFFQDHGAVGRIPFLMPVRWVDGWPMLGDENGKVPFVMKKPVQVSSPSYPLVISDEFDNNFSKNKNESNLALNWQWNHHPDNEFWSLIQRPGYLRITTGKVVPHFFDARNTLTQRTEGPYCSAKISMDVSHMKDGDCAGLSAFCYDYGMIAVKKEGDKSFIVVIDRDKETARIPLCQKNVFLKINFDFMKDNARFLFSLDGESWTPLGDELHMVYSTMHFIGYRIALLNYATKEAGGYVDFDYFRYERELPVYSMPE